MDHCTATVVYIQTLHHHTSVKWQQNAAFIYHGIAIQVPETNIPIKYQSAKYLAYMQITLHAAVREVWKYT